jgi:hypothetical protein
MRSVLVMLVFAAHGITADGPALADRVLKISQVERGLPWFWSRSAEGMADVPYTHLTRLSRVVRGKRPSGGLSDWRMLQLERVPLDWGSFMRCVSQDGRSPCSDEWNRELERQEGRRDQLTAEDRARIDRTREERRNRRRAFWDRFGTALKFESAGPNEIRFSPLTPGSTLLGSMSGRLRFDPATWRITRLEYDLPRDVEDEFGKLPKGFHFEIVLELSSDGDYLPLRIVTRQPREETTSEFTNYRRFDSKSTIRFGDQL